MKFLILALISLPAAASWFSGVGEYSRPHEIVFFGYETEEACVADSGRWDDGACIMEASDDVSVKDDGAHGLDVTVSTITTNGHMCTFEGKGKFTNEGNILASAPSEIWDGEDFHPAICEVTLSFVDGNTMNVSSTWESCANFCGSNATLDIEGAKRVGK